jgi:alanine racemase
MLLTAIDTGLGPCFFGIPTEQIDAYRAAFGAPARSLIGAISIGYLDGPPRELGSRRELKTETVYRGWWTRPGK